MSHTPDPLAVLQAQAQALKQRVALGRRCARLPLPWAYGLAHRLTGLAGHNLPGPPAQQRAVFEAWAASVRTAWVEARPQPSTRALWQAACASYAASLVNAALHRERLAAIAQRVRSHDPDWRRLLAETSGALVLTVHHDFHHTLFALAGRAGGRIRVIAAPEESSPLHPWLGPTIHALHRDCAGHFNGGDYLFLAPGESGTGVAHALRRGEWVFSLHDFEAPEGTRRHNAQVLNRQFQAPSGALELALRMGKPVYFAALVWQPGRRSYHLHARLLGPDAADPLVAYTQALAQLVRQWPWAWSGWQWFDSWSPLGDPLQRNECERLS